MQVLLIDNHDSFTHNLRQMLGGLGASVVVRRAGAEAARESATPDRVVLSPGPGHPDAATGCAEAFQRFRGRVPVLAVCLGMQVVARSLGLTVHRGGAPVHGRADRMDHDGAGLYAGLPNPLTVGRYHSLAVVGDRLPAGWRASGRAREDDCLMSFRSEAERVEALQFHPESVLTPDGDRLLAAFLGGRDP